MILTQLWPWMKVKVYHHAEFERNWFLNVQTQASIDFAGGGGRDKIT